LPSGTIGNAHDLACTSEEWADSSWWTAIRCSSVEAGYRLIDNLKILTQQILTDVGDMFGGIFPFNIPIQIYDQWQLSEDESLPENIAWLELADENNDITIPVPAGWNRGTSTRVVIWGDSIFVHGDPSLADVFAKIRALSTYLIWAGFIFAIWKLGEDIYNDLRD